MPPAYTLMGIRNSEISTQLGNWSRLDRRGVVTASTAGFVLPNGARRSPDAGWTLKSRIQQLPPESQAGFWHLCPDFVIELKSTTDRPQTLDRKLREYLANGAQLGWLLDPETRSVTLYRPDREPEKIAQPSSVKGEGPVAGFTLDLTRVWDPFA